MSIENSFDLPVPRDDVMREHIEASHRKTTLWWECRNTSPVLGIGLRRQNFPVSRANDFWPDIYHEPDFPCLVTEQIRLVNACAFGGDAAPTLAGNYGSRGTPMILSLFLGATPKFDDQTIWCDPIIGDIKDFAPSFDPQNPWLRRSLHLFQEQTRAISAGILPCIPGIGDCLTNLSGLRGVQDLLFDVIDAPREIHRIREIMIPAFVEAYQMFCAQYPAAVPGTATWLSWAPGTTYPVQCDFSTLLSPDMFKEFVLPEVEYLSDYIEYMCWHLDGPDELKHLDILLECPHIKAIQWLPGAGQPMPADEKWRPVIEKILKAGKAVTLGASSLEQARALVECYPHPGLCISCRDVLNEENVMRVEKYFGLNMW